MKKGYEKGYEKERVTGVGKHPPGVKLQDFIHDPKLERVPEVKAQIRMQFQTLTGQPIVAVRSFQMTNVKVSRTEWKLTSKQLEAVLPTPATLSIWTSLILIFPIRTTL